MQYVVKLKRREQEVTTMADFIIGFLTGIGIVCVGIWLVAVVVFGGDHDA